MSVLTDILATLDRWEEWKKIRETPSRIEALQKRIEEIESKLKRAPGEACPRCGALEFRVEKSERARPPFHRTGRTHYLKCKDCGYGDERTINS
jgi:ribosomal protein L37E